MDQNILTTQQAADLLKLTNGRIRQLARKGILKAKKFGRDWQIERESALRYKAARERGGDGGRGDNI